MKKIIALSTLVTVVMIINSISIFANNNQDMPHVLMVWAPSNTSIEIVFSEEVTQESAENEDNYIIKELYGPLDLIVVDAQLDESKTKVILTTANQKVPMLYQVSVSNVYDMNGNVVKDQKTFAGRN